ncbi:MAG: hypothetical protein ICV59_09240 [Thermoleophilia bacterium]|nr:hypothetical protein [Thermoleophilia bacterium]
MHPPQRPRLLVTAAAAVAAMLLPAAADAAQLIARNPTQIRLQVSRHGQALVSYRSYGRQHHTLAWGAINARLPGPDVRQVAFNVDYSGGWRSFRRSARQFRGTCGAYDGPPLRWKVAACKAADGTYWALQLWQRALPNYGAAAPPHRRVYELWLSHWRGPLPVLEVNVGWALGRYHTLFGRATYLGKPLYGFGTTRLGAPTDKHGRLVYVDTWGSAYGSGWRRENSFVTHRQSGAFCYGFWPHGDRPSGVGKRYRATLMAPGVLPDVYWEGVAPSVYDAAFDATQKQKLRDLNDRLCG